jgi:hypothetical protein
MPESISIQGFHQISCYFQFLLNTEAQPASVTRVSVKKNSWTDKEHFSIRDEVCRIWLGCAEWEADGTDLNVTCQIIKTGCGIPKKNERKKLLSHILIWNKGGERELYICWRNINQRSGLARFRFEIWKVKEIRTGIKEGRSLYVMKMKMRCVRYLWDAKRHRDRERAFEL